MKTARSLVIALLLGALSTPALAAEAGANATSPEQNAARLQKVGSVAIEGTAIPTASPAVSLATTSAAATTGTAVAVPPAAATTGTAVAVPPAAATAPTTTPATAPSSASWDGAAVYTNKCALCHATGLAGAPKFGDAAAWAPRIKKGTATLYQHSISGLNGVMPPRGTCTECTDDQLKAAVDYMVKAAS